MKRFLLVFGILLCMQCCTLAKDLYDLGDGFYVDLNSFRSEGNYVYAIMESNLFDSSYSMQYLVKFDLNGQKFRIMKVYILDKYGKIVSVMEEDDMPKNLNGWREFVKM